MRIYTDFTLVAQKNRYTHGTMIKNEYFTTLLFILALTPYVFADTENPTRVTKWIQSDPRVEPYSPHPGTTPKGEMKNGYVVIVWANPSVSNGLKGYQIWGDKRIVNQQTLEAALTKLLEKHPKDVYYVANNWAAGIELKPMLKKFTDRFKIKCSGHSTFGFDSVDFREEPQDVKAHIAKSLDEIEPVKEQEGIEKGTSTADPDSKSEGGNKQQP